MRVRVYVYIFVLCLAVTWNNYTAIPKGVGGDQQMLSGTVQQPKIFKSWFR